MKTGVFGGIGLALTLAVWLSGCAGNPGGPTPRAGHLMVIGGGLDDDARSVYERFVKLASGPGTPRILLVTAATEEGYDERSEVGGKTEALGIWAPGVPVEVIRRQTPTAETVAAIDRATGMLFTGGDQSRLTGRYRPGGGDTPELRAMRRLLARGGVIAGCSAGDTMMGEFMVLRGDNARALGSPKNEARGAVHPLQLGRGMGLEPWAITESHFFERDRVPRLVAALEGSGRRLGIGVGEDAAVEIDLARGEVTGVTESDSLLIDVSSMEREGALRRNGRARLIRRGETVSLTKRLAEALPSPPSRPEGPVRTLRVASPSQNRQLAMWRVFLGASRPGSGTWETYFDEGWRLTAWPDGRGEVIFEVAPADGPRSPALRNIIE